MERIPLTRGSNRPQWFDDLDECVWRIRVISPTPTVNQVLHEPEAVCPEMIIKIIRSFLNYPTNRHTHKHTRFCVVWRSNSNKLCGRPPQYALAPCKLTFDLLTLKVVPESRVTWATSIPISIFLGLSVLDLGPMYATDRQTSDAHHRLMPPTLGVGW